jgi:hypothetical protein
MLGVRTAQLATLSTLALAASLIAVTVLGGASASVGRGGAAPPHFRAVATGGLCDDKAAYHATFRQDGDNVVATIRFRHGGVRAHWDFSSTVKTDFGDGSGVVGSGDGATRADANGHFGLSGSTPVGVRHEFTFHLLRADTKERCFIRVRA